jgi:hypothetical protein
MSPLYVGSSYLVSSLLGAIWKVAPKRGELAILNLQNKLIFTSKMGVSFDWHMN